jgi:hypothetical protein
MRFRILSLVASMLMTGSVGYACACGGESSPRVRLDQAKIVFSGVVLDVNRKAVKLEVEKAYKGSVEKETVLSRSDQETTCDILFSKGEKYLVYAYDNKLDDKVVLMTDVCAGTARYSDAKGDIEYLETPAQFPERRELDPPKFKKARPRAQSRRRKP